MKLLLGFILCLISGLVIAGELSENEKKAEVALDLTLTFDALQTMDIKNHRNLKESNQILGEHPSDIKVITYFVVSGYLHRKLTEAAPSELRPVIQYTVIAYELSLILHNKRLGLNFSF